MEAIRPFQGWSVPPFLPQKPVGVCGFLVIGGTGIPTLRTEAGWQHQQKRQAEEGAAGVLGAFKLGQTGPLSSEHIRPHTSKQRRT